MTWVFLEKNKNRIKNLYFPKTGVVEIIYKKRKKNLKIKKYQYCSFLKIGIL